MHAGLQIGVYKQKLFLFDDWINLEECNSLPTMRLAFSSFAIQVMFMSLTVAGLVLNWPFCLSYIISQEWVKCNCHVLSYGGIGIKGWQREVLEF